jgi:DNA-binding transcriptional regulator PaaX
MNFSVIQHRVLRSLAVEGTTQARTLAKSLWGESWQPQVYTASAARVLRQLMRRHLTVERHGTWELTPAGRQTAEDHSKYEIQVLHEIALQGRLTTLWIQHLVFRGFSSPTKTIPGVRAFLVFLESEGLLHRLRERSVLYWKLSDDGRRRLVEVV